MVLGDVWKLMLMVVVVIGDDYYCFMLVVDVKGLWKGGRDWVAVVDVLLYVVVGGWLMLVLVVQSLTPTITIPSLLPPSV